ncbi:MAG: TonB-dependent receptor [Pseudobacteriovorax sp.]|nr:TonB-dependent receptor [Pseudobacteriovorax sp.]
MGFRVGNTGAIDLADILETVPSLRIHKGLRGDSLSFLGMVGKHVKIMINGNPIAGRISGEYDLTRIKLNNVEKIEIIKGPSSSLHGSDAMAGVINIVTKWENESGGVFGWQSFTNNKNSSYGQLTQHFSRSQVDISANYQKSSGYRIDDEKGLYKSPRTDERTAQVQWGTDTDSQRISVIGSYQARYIRNTDYLSTGAVFQRRNRVQHTQLILQDDIVIDDQTIVRLKGEYTGWVDKFHNDQVGSDALDKFEKTEQFDKNLGAELTHLFDFHQVVVGIEKTSSEFSSDRLDSADDYHRERYAAYLQDRWHLNKLLITGGIRQEGDSQFGDHLSHKLALEWAFNVSTKLTLSESRGYRAPDFKELYMEFINSSVGYQVEGNENLEPELSTYHSLEFSHVNKGFITNLRLFQNRAKNLISFEIVPESIGTDRTIYRYENIYRAIYKGAEIEFNYRFTLPLALSLAHSYIEARSEETNAYLSNRPLNSTKVSLQYFPAQNFSLILSFNHYAKRAYYDDIGTIFWEDPYTLGRFAATYHYSDRIQFQLGVKNIFDSGDSVHLPIEPRNGYIGIKLVI